jgi:hypothetical protein
MGRGGKFTGFLRNRGIWGYSIHIGEGRAGGTGRTLSAVWGDFEGFRDAVPCMDFSLSIELFLVGLPA